MMAASSTAGYGALLASFAALSADNGTGAAVDGALSVGVVSNFARNFPILGRNGRFGR
jgi:hypothetical protein